MGEALLSAVAFCAVAEMMPEDERLSPIAYRLLYQRDPDEAVWLLQKQMLTTTVTEGMATLREMLAIPELPSPYRVCQNDDCDSCIL